MKISYLVIAYNQEQFVRAAIKGVLAQDWPELEIVLSDDCSADRSFAIMEEIAAGYDGPHRIILNRNPVNLDLLAHLYKAASLASGDLLIIAEADDIPLPQRTRRTFEEWQRSCADALSSYYHVIDAQGTVIEKDYRCDVVDRRLLDRPIPMIHGASAAYTRRVFAKIAPPPGRHKFEDVFFSYMIARKGWAVATIEEPLVLYRRHPGSATNARSGTEPAEVLAHERWLAETSRSFHALLTALRRQGGAGCGMDQLIAYQRFRSEWMEHGTAWRLMAAWRMRRSGHLRWAAMRLFGIRGIIAVRKVKGLLGRG
jgi:glycosyltransferase involved in cell wall biosynthesis